VDAPSRVRQAAVRAAEQDEDLLGFLPQLMRITRNRELIDRAIVGIDRELLDDAPDPLLLRARSLLASSRNIVLFDLHRRRTRA
jgi:hypothetical protein